MPMLNISNDILQIGALNHRYTNLNEVDELVGRDDLGGKGLVEASHLPVFLGVPVVLPTHVVVARYVDFLLTL